MRSDPYIIQQLAWPLVYTRNLCKHALRLTHVSPPPSPHMYANAAKVEYAIEAINNAGTCVGILAKDGIVMAAERKVVSKLLAPSKSSEKTYRCEPWL